MMSKRRKPKNFVLQHGSTAGTQKHRAGKPKKGRKRAQRTSSATATVSMAAAPSGSRPRKAEHAPKKARVGPDAAAAGGGAGGEGEAVARSVCVTQRGMGVVDRWLRAQGHAEAVAAVREQQAARTASKAEPKSLLPPGYDARRGLGAEVVVRSQADRSSGTALMRAMERRRRGNAQQQQQQRHRRAAAREDSSSEDSSSESEGESRAAMFAR